MHFNVAVKVPAAAYMCFNVTLSPGVKTTTLPSPRSNVQFAIAADEEADALIVVAWKATAGGRKASVTIGTF